MLGEYEAPSSLFSKCCYLQCSGAKRSPSGIEGVAELKGLSGLTLQKGSHSTAGSLQTLKFAPWDAEKRIARVPVFGGFGYPGTESVWTEPVTPVWNCLINVARCCNYTYVFEFSEDYRHSRIHIKSNLCCCVPCVPAWCTVPSTCAVFEMEQAEGTTGGSHWHRNSSKCGGKMEKTYDLVEVLKADETPGPFHADLAAYAPEAMLLSR